jgi:ABC-2 type transport system ATP-binding protein
MHDAARNAIQTRALVQRFGAFTAVDELALAVPPGEIFGLLGSNGAGKSTTIKILTTLLPPTSGSATVAGFDVVRQPIEVRRRIGYVPQLVSADAGLTGRENLLLAAKLHGLPRAERAERIDASLAFMGLSEVGDALVRTYSGGMIRRLEIAQAMLPRPVVLFLDEPTVGLDPNARKAVWERIQKLRAEHDTTVLITTHDMEEADTLCDRIAIMHRGRIVVEGAPAKLKADIGKEARLDDVFVEFTGGAVEGGGNFRDVARTRRTASRLG